MFNLLSTVSKCLRTPSFYNPALLTDGQAVIRFATNPPSERNHAGTLQYRAYSAPSLEQLRSLPVGILQRSLDAGKVDYRHCVEKKDLIAKVHEVFASLPLPIRSELLALAQGPRSELAPADIHQALVGRISRLQPDEQYSVRLFQEARPSVAHIATFVQAPVFLQLNPEVIRPGTGSGFLWDAQHVVTNYHVVQSAHRVKVTLSNQLTYDASVVGTDASNDLAVLKLSSAPLDVRPISVGTSHDLMVGQRVFAIGNPFGLDQTLTAGIVSSVNRQIRGAGNRIIRDVIQTDAAINPGNSGGPLLDSNGRLIGVNTMIFSPSGGNIGIGFAVPINTVRRVVAQLVSTGRVRRGRVGISLLGDEPSTHIRHALQLPTGVIVNSVEPDSGAAQAGIRGFSYNAAGEPVPGDLIVAVGGERVQSSEDILAIIEQFNVGDMVPITVLRGRKQLVVNVTVKEMVDK